MMIYAKKSKNHHTSAYFIIVHGFGLSAFSHFRVIVLIVRK